MKNSTFTPLILAFVSALLATNAFAQSRYNDRAPAYNDSRNYVTVYEDCDFRGKSRALDIGDYRDVEDLNLRNDEISSVEVPDGLSLILYEHERFGGKSTLISSDVRCLNRSWDNETSSLKVQADQEYSGSNRRRFDDRQEREPFAGARGRNLTSNVSYVSFASSELEQTRGKQWQIVNRNGSVDRFREIARDRQTITLRSERINQRLIVDLRDQHVRFIQPNGKIVDYSINSTDARSRNRNARDDRRQQERGVINSSCFNYRAYTRGGNGGIRFHGHDGFHRFTKKAHSGRICHDGPLTMEINKNKPGTDVIVDINGRSYRFAPNEPEDVFKNTWYRKKIKLEVGR